MERELKIVGDITHVKEGWKEIIDPTFFFFIIFILYLFIPVALQRDCKMGVCLKITNWSPKYRKN